jgi:S1-C subfamily serine protease
MTHPSSFQPRGILTVVVFVALTASLCFAQDTPELTIPTDKAQTGAMVDGVTAGGPAATAGILPHDTITAVEGTPVQSLRQILEALVQHNPGDTMGLTVVRASDGTTTEVTMVLATNPIDPSQPYMGLTFITRLHTSRAKR